jgi:hypothetical protein
MQLVQRVASESWTAHKRAIQIGISFDFWAAAKA